MSMAFHPDLIIPGQDRPALRLRSPGAARFERRNYRPIKPGAPPKVERRLTPSIYHEHWWLNIASEGTYQEATVEKAGRVIARLPYVVTRNWAGQKMLGMPPLTNVLGPAILPEIAASDSTRALKQFGITRDLIAQLPEASYAWFRMHRHVSDTLAFEGAGYTPGCDFTVEIAPAPPEQLWKQMRDKTRNAIRRAEQELVVTDVVETDDFLDFYEDNLVDRGKTNRRPRHIVKALVDESVKRGAGRLLAAIDAQGDLAAAIFVVRNHEVEHYLMSTRSLNSSRGAISLLIWNALQDASASGLTFDTDGLMPSNLELQTGFGGTIRPRHVVTIASEAYRIGERAEKLADKVWQRFDPRGWMAAHR